MSDQPDPWALVLRHRSQRGGFIVTSSDVRAAFAEVERRHAEALKVKDTEHQRHFEIMQQTQNLASSIMDTLRTQLKDAIAMRDAIADAKTPVSASEMSELEMANAVLRAQLAAVQEKAQAVLREWDDYKTTGQLRVGGAMYDLRVALEPLTLKEPTLEGGTRHE